MIACRGLHSRTLWGELDADRRPRRAGRRSYPDHVRAWTGSGEVNVILMMYILCVWVTISHGTPAIMVSTLLQLVWLVACVLFGVVVVRSLGGGGWLRVCCLVLLL